MYRKGEEFSLPMDFSGAEKLDEDTEWFCGGGISSVAGLEGISPPPPQH